MPPVDPASQLAALIRVQVASLRRQAPAGSALAQRTGPAPSQPEPDLPALVADRIRSLDRDDPQRARKAFRMFLETVLLSELGPQLVNDPAFARMVDHVQAQMEGDAGLAQASREAAQVLLDAADGAG